MVVDSCRKLNKKVCIAHRRNSRVPAQGSNIKAIRRIRVKVPKTEIDSLGNASRAIRKRRAFRGIHSQRNTKRRKPVTYAHSYAPCSGIIKTPTPAMRRRPESYLAKCSWADDHDLVRWRPKNSLPESDVENHSWVSGFEIPQPPRRKHTSSIPSGTCRTTLNVRAKVEKGSKTTASGCRLSERRRLILPMTLPSTCRAASNRRFAAPHASRVQRRLWPRKSRSDHRLDLDLCRHSNPLPQMSAT